MAISTFADISAMVNDLIENSLAVARMTNVLLPTVTKMGAKGLMNREVHERTAVTFTTATETTDTTAQSFDKTLLATLSPAIYRARVDLTDARVESDFDGELAAAATELGSAAGRHVDVNIAAAFTSLTGGTIGATGTPITWAHITKAYALLVDQNVPAASPVFCALHPFQWEVLLRANSVAAATVAVAPNYQDRLAAAPNFFTIPAFQGITFVITNAITIDGATDDAYGALYVPEALAVDSRKPFNIRPQRDESLELTELNASLWYAHGAWRPNFGIKILASATTPS